MSPDDVAHAIATALEPIVDEIPELQIYWYHNRNPTLPSLDVLSGDPFQVGAGFGVGNKRVSFVVRALVPAADGEAAHQLLYRLMDPAGPAGVEPALAAADVAEVEEVSGIGTYPDVTDALAATWRVGAFLE